MPCKLLQVLQKVLSTSACMQAWCDKKGLDAAIHPIPKCVIFLEDLLQEMVVNKSNVACSRTPQWRYRDRYHCEVCSSIEREAHVIQTHLGDVIKFFMCIIIQRIL